MKKFLFIYHGLKEFTPEIMEAWGSWFESVADSMVDSGSPLGPGTEVTRTGTREVSPDLSPATGYSIVNANSLDEALGLLEDCPIVDSVRVYEAKSM